MSFELAGTLARLKTLPYIRAQSIALPAEALASRIKGCVKGDDTKLPDSEAVWFYALNQMAAVVMQKATDYEPLPPAAARVIAAYESQLRAQHRRMLWYVFLITSREWRHCHNIDMMVANYPVQHVAQSMKPLHKKVSDSSSQATIDNWLAAVDSSLSLLNYVKFIEHCFYKGSWSGGYGGKAWGLITKTLRVYIEGLTTAETFIDTAYTLAHNNGPIFNKAMLYTGYTSNFKQSLDIQRSGQMCEAMLDGQFAAWSIEVENKADLLSMIKDFKALYPGTIGDYCDWYKVEAAGAICGPYTSQKSYQKKTHGPSPYEGAKVAKHKPGLFETPDEEVPEAVKATVKKTATPILVPGIGKALVSGNFEPFPGESVTVVTRIKE